LGFSRTVLLALLIVLAASAVIMAVATGVLDVSFGFVAMGRADHEMWSLTGRLPLWQELLEVYVPNHELTGYGYGAFWTAERVAEIADSQSWTLVLSAHSMYMDLLLNVGYVGAALYVAAALCALARFWRGEFRHPAMGYGFMAALLIFELTVGLTETAAGATNFPSVFVICGIGYLFYDANLVSRQPARGFASGRKNTDPKQMTSQAGLRSLGQPD
jgi:O-antigen ligase